VKKVVTAMVSDKVSGDDFSLVFFQACWDVLRVDCMKIFRDFHARG
jgi:hypothetical protein